MEPVNFAEVIAQIDVEMQRLGWTREQEREHLKRNYGKRSHTLLTEVELLDFLQYFVSQPTRALDEIFIKTSSKQSRSLLTQEELLGFFNYLESQPTVLTVEYLTDIKAEY